MSSANVTDTQSLIEYVRTTLNSFPKWDVVTFFHNNPFAWASAEDIAESAGRDMQEVRNALPALIEVGIVAERNAGTQTIYQFTGDSSVREQVATFVAACEDRDFRTLAIQSVIEGASAT